MSVLMAKLLSRVYREENDGVTSGDGDGKEVVGTGNDARLAMLQRINDENDQRDANNGDLVDLDENGKPVPFVVRQPDGAEEKLDGKDIQHEQIIDHDADNAAETERLRLEAEALAKQQQAQPQMVKLKVNGVEVEVTLEEALARAQKVTSADQYLAEAARTRNELATQKQAAPTEEQVAEDDLALARAIQMGSEEEAVAAIRKMKAPTLSQDVLARTVDERLTFNEAISKFRRDFKDIFEDPFLNKMAMEKDAELIKNGDPRSYGERYAAIGNEIRTWVASKAPVQTKTVVPPVVDKQPRNWSPPGWFCRWPDRSAKSPI